MATAADVKTVEMSCDYSRYLNVSAIYTDRSRHPRFAEEHFAERVGSTLDRRACEVINYGVGDKTSQGWPVHTLVSFLSSYCPRADNQVDALAEMEDVLRKLAPKIKSVLSEEFTDVKIIFVRKTTLSEIL